MRDTRLRDVLMIVAGSISAISTLLVGLILPAHLRGGEDITLLRTFLRTLGLVAIIAMGYAVVIVFRWRAGGSR